MSKKKNIDKILNKQKRNYVDGINRNIPFDSDQYVHYHIDQQPLSSVPYKGYSHDDRDDKIKYIQAVQNEAPLSNVFDKPRLTPEYIDLMKKRLEETEEIDFERYVLNLLPGDQIAAQQLLQSEFPNIIQSREDTIDTYCEFLKSMCSIALRGIQTKDDMFLVYNLQTGRVNLPPGILASIFNMDIDSINQPPVLGRGMFNPKKYRRLANRKDYELTKIPYPYNIDSSGQFIANNTGIKIKNIDNVNLLKTNIGGI